MKKAAVLLAVVAVLALIGTAQAGWNKFTVTEGNWSNASNWSLGNVPGCSGGGWADGENAEILGAKTCHIDIDTPCSGNDFNDLQWVYVGSCNHPGEAKVYLDTDHVFSPRFGVNVGEGCRSDSGRGTFIQTNGTLGGSPDKTSIRIADSETKYYQGYGTYIISGGNINNVSILMGPEHGWKKYFYGYGFFTIDNSAGTVGTIQTGTFFESPRSTFKIILDSNGNVPTVEVSGDATLSGVLRLEYTGYTPTPGTVIDVLTAGGTLTYKNHTMTYDDDGDGDTPEIPLPDLVLSADDPNWVLGDDGAGTLQLTYVPEPATLVLLGLGGCLVLLRRKK